VKLFCQGTASVRQWKRIRYKRDNLSLGRIKACVTSTPLMSVVFQFYQKHSHIYLTTAFVFMSLCFISERFYNYSYLPCTKCHESIHDGFNKHIFIFLQCYSFGKYRKLHFVHLASTSPLNSIKSCNVAV